MDEKSVLPAMSNPTFEDWLTGSICQSVPENATRCGLGRPGLDSPLQFCVTVAPEMLTLSSLKIPSSLMTVSEGMNKTLEPDTYPETLAEVALPNPPDIAPP
jgi:hypothetical protein